MQDPIEHMAASVDRLRRLETVFGAEFAVALLMTLMHDAATELEPALKDEVSSMGDGVLRIMLDRTYSSRDIADQLIRAMVASKGRSFIVDATLQDMGL